MKIEIKGEKMKPEREEQYIKLEEKIGNTKVEEFIGDVPNGNKIWIKRENDNPFGSHYDRVYLEIIRHFEKTGRIKQGDTLLETTSGTAGASFVGIGAELGFNCEVAIPEGVDQAIIDLITSKAAKTYFTPEQDYINGFPDFVRGFLPEHPEIIFLNHSMGKKSGAGFSNNELALKALEGIAREALRDVDIDTYLPAVGNGSSVLGPGRVLKAEKKDIQIVTFETFQAAVAYDQLSPGKYFERFGIQPGILPRHKLRGTSYQGIDFPHVRHSIEDSLIDDAILVSDRWQDRDYNGLTGRSDTLKLPHWDQVFRGYEWLGRTGRAGIAAALEIAKEFTRKNILIVAYDDATRYDSEKIIG